MTHSGPLIALTGATGFVGRAILSDLRAHGFQVRVLLRRPVEDMPDTDSVVIGDLSRPINLSQAFEGVDVVVHSAGLTPQMSGRPSDDFRAINTDATIALARAAARNRVRRFIFLSSVRAQSGPVAAGILSESTPPEPTCDYGRSKLAAEQGLADCGIEWAALRSVLVYGPGHEGNLARLIGLSLAPFPMPLPAPSGRRSLLAVDNLASAVRFITLTEETVGGAYLVADDDALTVKEIVTEIRRGAQRLPMTLPVPAAAMRAAAAATGQRAVVDRLAGDLVVDTARLKSLGWRALLSSRDGLRRLGTSEHQ